jgi:hypothetical protein
MAKRKPTCEEILQKVWVHPRDLVILGAVGSTKTIYNQIVLGKCPIPHTKFGQSIRFKLRDVLAHMKKNTVMPKEAAE